MKTSRNADPAEWRDAIMVAAVATGLALCVVGIAIMILWMQ